MSLSETSSPAVGTSPRTSVLIVGAGAWGSSTAVALLKSGMYTVTLLDRAEVLPAEDAASTDINKIVRFDYEDPVYAELAYKALQVWRQPEWEGMYFESGTVVTAPQSTKDHKHDLDHTIACVSRLGPVIPHSTAEEVERALDPKGTGVAGNMVGRRGYSNPQGGWVNAAKATATLIRKATELGGQVVPGAEATELIFQEGDVKGVKSTDGREFRADKVIVASGGWTPGLLEGLLPEGLITAAGITVAAFRLSEEEYERYKDIPVIMGWDAMGFYSMPPTHDRMLKFGLDEAGYSSKTGRPRTTLTPSAASWHSEHKASWLPRTSFEGLCKVVNLYYPEFKDRPFDFTRMCPIPATFDDHFIIDYHSEYKSLLVASGGSHHGYKFMPTIGTLIQSRLENTLDPALVRLWAIRQPDLSKGGHAATKQAGSVHVEDVEFAAVGELGAPPSQIAVSA